MTNLREAKLLPLQPHDAGLVKHNRFTPGGMLESPAHDLQNQVDFGA
jgi:hypothetical protein